MATRVPSLLRLLCKMGIFGASAFVAIHDCARRPLQNHGATACHVDDIDAIVARMRDHGAELIGEMQYADTHRLAYIRGPEGIIVAMAEQLG